MIKGSTAFEGFGEMKDENGRMNFKNVHDLNFQNGIILKKTDCFNNKEWLFFQTRNIGYLFVYYEIKNSDQK